MRTFLFISLMFLALGLVNAQPLTGIKSIPDDYATIQLAIADLNSKGVGTNGVIFNVAANHTETLVTFNSGSITATGNATDTIVFRKDPATSGNNPKITSFVITTASVQTDGIIKIEGGDYFTFDGIDLSENAVNLTNKRTEWGYALVKKSATAPFDGCQHITIKNCTITLDKGNINAVGIYSGNHIATAITALTITATTDACNNCKFYSNNISNVYSGIKLNGFASAGAPYTLYDQNNEIGVGGGNLISNYGSGASACYGIFGAYQNQLKIMNNSISGGNTTSSTQYCIAFNTSNAASGEIAFNNIANPGNSTTPALNAIQSDAGAGGTSNTISIHDNTITTCTSSGPINLIYYNSNANTVNIYNNTLNGASGAGLLQGIYAHPAVTTGTLNIYNNDISNLVITNTSKFYGIVGGGYTSTSIYANTLFNCSSLGQSVYGISATASGTWNWNVEGNEIYNLASNNGSTTNSFVYGIYFQGGSTVNVTLYNNFISDLKVTISTANPAICGINLSTGSTFNVNNNTVFLNSTGSASVFTTVAFRVASGPTTTLRNNNFVNISVPGATGKTICYQNVGGSIANYSSLSNNNNYYAGAPGDQNLIFYMSTSAWDKTIATFKARVSPRDSQSFSENPPFQNKTTAPYNLHIPADSITFCESGGITVAVPDIKKDIDGDWRFPNTGYPDHPVYHASAPDVGADEFGGIHNDLIPPVISVLPLANTSSLGSRTLVAKISDISSGIPPASPGLPRLYWKINDAVTWNNSTGSLSGVDQYSFSFGSGAILADVVYYFICAQDNFINPNVSVSPGAGADGLSADPPACSVTPLTPYAYRIVGTLPAGNYLIGGTGDTPSPGCTYVDITQAFADVNNVVDRIVVTNGGSGYNQYNTYVTFSGGGGSGASAEAVVDEYGMITAINVTTNGDGYYKAPSVVITGDGIDAAATAYIGAGKEVTGKVNFILDATYLWSEENTFPVHLEPFVGAGPAKTITLKPAPLTSPVIYANSGTSVLKINGADYFTIDGSNNGSTSKDLTLYYLPAAINAAVVWIASATEIDGATHNTVKNCVIQGSASNTLMYAGIFSGGTASIEYNYYALSPNSYNTFENNNFFWARNGIAALGKSTTEPDEGLNIKNNQLGNDASGEGLTRHGIYIENQASGLIAGNHIQNVTYDNLFYWVTGIYLSNTKSMTLSANKIHNVRLTANATSYWVDGIYQNAPLFNTSGNPSANTYVNNVIYDLTSNGASSYYNVVGIHNVNGWGDQYYYNSVYLAGPLNQTGSSNGSMSACFSNGQGVNGLSTNNIEVKDNVFYINSNNSSGVNHHYAHYSVLSTYAGSNLDYNLLLDSVTGTAIGHVGHFNSSDQDNISQWRAATSQDNASLSLDPMFISATDLAPQTGSPLLEAGIPVPGITTDFTGAPRNGLHPSIGAYEVAEITGKLWNGSVSSDWNNGLNWTPAGIPQASEDLIIPSGTPFNCILNATGAVCTNIVVSTAAVMTMMTGSEITVNGDFTIMNGGTLNNDGILNLKGDLVNQNP
jgi:trimeric autotransporter adhesin